MRIAVLLSGRIVNPEYEYTLKQFDNMFKNQQITYFISINSNVHDAKFTEQFARDLYIDSECINIEKTEEPQEIYRYRKKLETNYHNTYSMFYHNKKCFEMLERYEAKYEVSFDIILKYRTDIQYLDDDKITFDNIEGNTIYIPCSYDHGGINDQIAYGDKESMRYYCCCVENIINMCRSEIMFHPETLLKEHLKSNVKVNRFQVSYKIMPKCHMVK